MGECFRLHWLDIRIQRWALEARDNTCNRYRKQGFYRDLATSQGWCVEGQREQGTGTSTSRRASTL